MNLSKIVSVIMHPILMPTATIYFSLKIIPNIGFAITNYLSYIYLILIVSTIIMPLVSLLFLIKKKVVLSLEMSNNKERSIPLLISLIWMIFGYYIIKDILIFAPILRAELMGGIIILLSASIISKYWKISLHMLGVGGFFGVLYSLHFLFGGLLEIIIISILLSGILAVARLNEKAHNKTQIYVGFMTGFLVEVCCILIF